jgi:hypothetical protein
MLIGLWKDCEFACGKISAFQEYVKRYLFRFILRKLSFCPYAKFCPEIRPSLVLSLWELTEKRTNEKGHFLYIIPNITLKYLWFLFYLDRWSVGVLFFRKFDNFMTIIRINTYKFDGLQNLHLSVSALSLA